MGTVPEIRLTLSPGVAFQSANQKFAVQENENKAKREQKSGCVAVFQLMIQKYFRGFGGKYLNPQIRIFVFKLYIFFIFIYLQGADDFSPLLSMQIARMHLPVDPTPQPSLSRAILQHCALTEPCSADLALKMTAQL